MPDDEVERNYQRVYWEIMKEVFNPEDRTNKDIREQVIGLVRDSLQFIFHDLRLQDDPEGKGTFYFEKGMLKNITMSIYLVGRKQLLIYYLILSSRRKYYPNTMCIDEPEAHMGLSAQGKLLKDSVQL